MTKKNKEVHICHARDCKVAISPTLLMCMKHWRMVPGSIKARVLDHYRAGQTVDKKPTHAYLEAAQDAVRAVAEIEERSR